MAEGVPTITLVQYGGLDRQKTMSHPCGKAHMGLHLKGLQYKLHNCRSPNEVKKYNDRGRVPVLIVDGESFVDSSDILTELDRRFPEPPLMPADPGARARVRILEDWADEVLYFFLVYARWWIPENFDTIKRELLSRLPIPLRWIVPGIARRQVRARLEGQGVGLKDADTVRREAAECLDALEALVAGGSFVVGDAFTRADLSLAAMIDQYLLARFNPELAAEVDKRPAIAAWLTRVRALVPSFAG